jgi:hypothetical protein
MMPNDFVEIVALTEDSFANAICGHSVAPVICDGCIRYKKPNKCEKAIGAARSLLLTLQQNGVVQLCDNEPNQPSLKEIKEWTAYVKSLIGAEK